MTITDGRQRLLKIAAPIAIFVLLSGALLASRGLIVKLYLHDIYFLFDGMWRSSLGQVPHVDFHTPIGQAYFWPYQLLGGLGDHDALTVIHAHVLVAAMLTAAMVALLPRRLTLLEIALTSAAILAMAMAPRDVDRWSSFDYSWLAPYNRWSWAIWMITVQAVLMPPARPRHGLDGVVLGLLAGFMLYTKITFFAGAGFVALVAAMLGRLPFRTALVAAGTLVAMILAIELIWHNNLAYLADLRMAMAGASEGHQVGRWAKHGASAGIARPYWLAVVAILWLMWPTTAPIGWLTFWRGPLGIAAAVLLVGMAVSLQDFPDNEFGHLVLAVLVAWQVARRKLAVASLSERPPAFTRSRRAMTASAIPVAVVMACCLLPTFSDLGSIATHAIQTRNGDACPIPALAGTQGAALMAAADQIAGLPAGSPTPPCDRLKPSRATPDLSGNKPIFYLQKVEQTMQVIHRYARPGEVILALDFSNPYPFLLRTEPPAGALLWMDMGRDYGYAAHPPAEPILRSVDIVLQTRIEANGDNYHAGRAWAVYGDAVRRYFHIVGGNDTITLWRRNGR